MSTPVRRQAIEDAVRTLTIAGVELSFCKDDAIKQIAGACHDSAQAGRRALTIWNEALPSVMDRNSKPLSEAAA